MIGLIITGHGEFAKGINSVIELVAGKQENVATVDFLENHSTEDLKNNLKEKIENMNTEGTLIFTDIPGGSPFKMAVELSMEHDDIEVIAGTNVPMIMEILFDRENVDLLELKNRAMEVGKKQIVTFEMKKKQKQQDEDDGI
ncbi:PTS galactosamine/N-acetylgalactosamine transporter subunit IIA [Senegalia massiliensis]|uniref:PTS sugar transporter subunit IIA n=1 Tax=Senegalia massiliensis TaxID=1720316 RepID=A0A845QYV5_9CLOT|nr:PTS galactosamine/N-acetylgalactosamine transporter subunit IIA [Senegalia massiliensis]NBI07340.1 PTS sugar transporter subunit IIA [Senegalia massiliensis]